jgi:hypothetical protein
METCYRFGRRAKKAAKKPCKKEHAATGYSRLHINQLKLSQLKL